MSPKQQLISAAGIGLVIWRLWTSGSLSDLNAKTTTTSKTGKTNALPNKSTRNPKSPNYDPGLGRF
jgi:hypothetical protein